MHIRLHVRAWPNYSAVLALLVVLVFLFVGPVWVGRGIENLGDRYLTMALMAAGTTSQSLWLLDGVPDCPEPSLCQAARHWLALSAKEAHGRQMVPVHLGLANVMLGDVGRAQAVWRTVESGFPSRLAALLMAATLAQQGRREAAREWWRKADVGAWLLQQALTQGRNAHPHKALTLVQDALAVRPSLSREAAGDVAEVYRLVGDTFARRGQWQDAVLYYRSMVEYAPERAGGYMNLANAYLNMHQYEAAIAAYDKAVALQPTNGDVRLRLAEAYRRAGMFGRAEEEARRVTELDRIEWRVRAYAFLGQLYEQTRRVGHAEHAYRLAIALNGGKPGHLHIRLAALLARQQRLTEAEALLRQVVQDGGKGLQLWAWQTLGQVYEAQKEWNEAEHAYREAIAVSPERDDSRLMLARVLRRVERFDEAEALYKEVTEGGNAGWRGQAWFELGTLYESQQRWAEAESAYRQALAVASQREDYRLRLAEFLLRQRREQEAEVLLLETTRSQNPGWRAQAWFSLGNLYWAQQRWTEAITAYEAAVEANPNNAGYWRRLADAYEQQGMPEKAEEARRKAR